MDYRGVDKIKRINVASFVYVSFHIRLTHLSLHFTIHFVTSNKENTVGSKATISTVPDPVLTDCSSRVDSRYLYSAHQKSGDRVTETVQFYVVITYLYQN